MKQFLIVVSAVVLLFAGCSKELEKSSDNRKDLVEIDVTASLPNAALISRAVWDNDGKAAGVNHWIMEIYDNGGILYNRQEKDNQSGLTNTFKATLVKNQTYRFVFWADTKGSYSTASLKSIKATDKISGKDSRDAFFCMKEYRSTASGSVSAELYRPFGQLNIVTLDAGKVYEEIGNAAEYAKFEPKDIKLKAKLYSEFNALTGALSGKSDVTLTEGNCYGKGNYSYASASDSTTIFMDYVFVGTEQELYDVDFEFKSNGEKIAYSFASIPMQRNFRTNVFGNLMSGDAEWNVVIKPEWNEPDFTEQ
ncbi:MAG: FimB/Mfa2 family fimbrial subunit [Bacteroidales bacterium]|nr:FimB/Mfa2 family fimbrial subunit [Candidatus Cacconaster merdequi]